MMIAPVTVVRGAQGDADAHDARYLDDSGRRVAHRRIGVHPEIWNSSARGGTMMALDAR
jgi:hypothetical protein